MGGIKGRWGYSYEVARKFLEEIRNKERGVKIVNFKSFRFKGRDNKKRFSFRILLFVISLRNFFGYKFIL